LGHELPPLCGRGVAHESCVVELQPPEPDLDAEKYDNEALHPVPNWHYVRDTLIPQINAAKTKKQ